MNYPLGDVFLGDLVKAVKLLEIEDSSVMEATASILGYKIEIISKTRDASKVRMAQEEKLLSGGDFTPISDRKREHISLPEIEPSEPLPDPTLPISNPVNFELEEYVLDRPEKESPENYWSEWDEPEEFPSNLTLIPLIQENWARGIISEVLSVDTYGSIDLEMAIEILAKAEPLENIPRKSLKRLNNRYQILVDVSESMTMFIKDIWKLVETIKSIAGSGELDVFLFRGMPSNGLEDENNFRVFPYKLPPPGTLVVIISNFSIPKSLHTFIEATQSQWIGYLRFLKESGYDVRAFVPFPSYRWPTELKKNVTFIHWDRKTTANSIRRAIESVV